MFQLETFNHVSFKLISPQRHLLFFLSYNFKDQALPSLKVGDEKTPIFKKNDMIITTGLIKNFTPHHINTGYYSTCTGKTWENAP